MKHLSPVNEKARMLSRAMDPRPVDAEAATDPASARDVVALDQQGPPQQPTGPHIPLGCSTIFSPGWEVDRTGGTAGLCQPVERDLFDCHLGCFWPAQVPDQLNHAPDWTKKCAAAQKDWRKIDLIFP
ncbi:MAG TPA: quinohemoprotein amine dehydrogenase subunit gamma [Vicinamibacterales bacterium]|nr:quinohemoprotein amine dehydrogenase subunit gamma [Vicinamibacterales bacterium]